MGKIKPWRRKTFLLDILSNNAGKLATSDTSDLTAEMIIELSQGCHELLDLLTPVFERFSDNPSLKVLRRLADKPISLLRCSALDWPGIETHLTRQINLHDFNLDETDRKLMQAVELEEWTQINSLESWKKIVARELFLSRPDFEKRLTRLQQLRGLRWDGTLGTCLFLR